MTNTPFEHKDVEGDNYVSSVFTCDSKGVPTRYRQLLNAHADPKTYPPEISEYEERFANKTWYYYQDLIKHAKASKRDATNHEWGFKTSQACSQCVGISKDPAWVAYLETNTGDLLSMAYFGKFQQVRDGIPRTFVSEADKSAINMNTCVELEFIANLDTRERDRDDPNALRMQVGGASLTVGEFTVLWALCFLCTQNKMQFDHVLIFSAKKNKKMDAIMKRFQAREAPMEIEVEITNKKSKIKTKAMKAMPDNTYVIDMTGNKGQRLRELATNLGISKLFPRKSPSPSERLLAVSGHATSGTIVHSSLMPRADTGNTQKKQPGNNNKPRKKQQRKKQGRIIESESPENSGSPTFTADITPDIEKQTSKGPAKRKPRKDVSSVQTSGTPTPTPTPTPTSSRNGTREVTTTLTLQENTQDFHTQDLHTQDLHTHDLHTHDLHTHDENTRGNTGTANATPTTSGLSLNTTTRKAANTKRVKGLVKAHQKGKKTRETSASNNRNNNATRNKTPTTNTQFTGDPLLDQELENDPKYNADIKHLRLAKSLAFSTTLIADPEEESEKHNYDVKYAKPGYTFMVYEKDQHNFNPKVVQERSLQEGALSLANALQRRGTFWVAMRDPYLHTGHRNRERLLYKVRSQKNVTKMSRIESMIRRFAVCKFEGTISKQARKDARCIAVVDREAVLGSKIVKPETDVYQIRILNGPYRVRFPDYIKLHDLKEVREPSSPLYSNS